MWLLPSFILIWRSRRWLGRMVSGIVTSSIWDKYVRSLLRQEKQKMDIGSNLRSCQEPTEARFGNKSPSRNSSRLKVIGPNLNKKRTSARCEDEASLDWSRIGALRIRLRPNLSMIGPEKAGEGFSTVPKPMNPRWSFLPETSCHNDLSKQSTWPNLRWIPPWVNR